MDMLGAVEAREVPAHTEAMPAGAPRSPAEPRRAPSGRRERVRAREPRPELVDIDPQRAQQCRGAWRCVAVRGPAWAT